MAKLFKDYTQDQCYLFPPNLNELISENHLVRVVDDFIEKIDISSVINSYPGGGSSAYHPRMLLKVIVYAYVEKIYSGRQIAKALRENVNFMWLAGGNKADFRTINRFRSKRMVGNIKSVFSSMIEYLIDSGYINFEKYFLDGTTIEANARRSSYVWKKNTNRHKNNLEENVRELFEEIERITEAENAEYGDEDLEELGENVVINSETMREKIEKVNRLLNEEPKNREAKKAKRKLERDYLPRMEKYEEQLEILGERNSYSKTDPDATMMRVKPNLRDAVVKPAYNVQIGTEDQFILGYSIHNNPVDIRVMGDHLEQVKDMVGKVPEILIADAGYGSEENYHIL
ncbi:MAG: IS1182 family transposase, partial [Anaerolineaceae bacterium]